MWTDMEQDAMLGMVIAKFFDSDYDDEYNYHRRTDVFFFVADQDHARKTAAHGQIHMCRQHVSSSKRSKFVTLNSFALF